MLIKQGVLEKLSKHKTSNPRMFYLFTDILLWAKPVPNTPKYEYRKSCEVSELEFLVVDGESKARMQKALHKENCILLKPAGRKPFSIFLKNEDFFSWVSVLEKAKRVVEATAAERAKNKQKSMSDFSTMSKEIAARKKQHDGPAPFNL